MWVPELEMKLTKKPSWTVPRNARPHPRKKLAI